MRVLRVHHGGRSAAQRERDRALVATGVVDETLVVPSSWPEPDANEAVGERGLEIVELVTRRTGDVNRHSYIDEAALAELVARVNPDVVDVHEEPFSLAARQWLRVIPARIPVVMYTAQNVDKRFPPPFSRYESAAYRRASGLYPCSRQAASVARGKGFGGQIEVLPLGYDPTVFRPGRQSLDDELVLGVFGRLVPEKGVLDAVEVLAALSATRTVRLIVVGEGPQARAAQAMASSRDVGDRIEIRGWQAVEELAWIYRRVHVVLVPSVATATWVEQFGRVIVEAQASGAVVAGYSSGAIPEVATGAGLLVPEGRVDLLSEGIANMVETPAVWTSLRRAGIDLARTRTWANVATRQLDLYQRVVADPEHLIAVPSDGAERRRAARAEFGQTARTPAGDRPFALPVLRRSGRVPKLLGRAIDAVQRSGARGTLR